MLPDVYFHTNCVICGEHGQPSGSRSDPALLVEYNGEYAHQMCRANKLIEDLSERLHAAERVTRRHMADRKTRR